jgi:hypothetical protein
MMMSRQCSTMLLGCVMALVSAGAVQAALQLRLEAANYDPVTGIWTDTSGNTNHATQVTAASRPSLVANQTPNGSSVVSFDGADDSLDLTAAIPVTTDADGYTVCAYVRPSDPSGEAKTIVSGARGSLQYRITAKQNFVKTGLVELGRSDTPLSTTSFNNISAQVNDDGGLYRLNGSPDGVPTSGHSFAPGITVVGRNASNGGEWFRGQIAEIRVYDEQLSLAAIQAIEAELRKAYETPTDAVSLPVIDNPTFDDNAYLFVDGPGLVGQGINPAEIASWPGARGRGINPGNGAGAAFRNNGANAGQVAFVRQGGRISNTISGWEAGKNYRLSFDYNSRASYAMPGLGVTLGTATFTDAEVPAVGGAFAYYTANMLLAPTGSTQVLSIENLNAAEDATLLIDNVRVFRTGPTIADNGFESPVQPANDFKTAAGGGNGDLAGSAWTMTGAAGISRNRSGFHNTMYASEGEQLGLIQNTGSFVQTVSGFVPGADYALSLLAMKRTNAGDGGNDLEVVLDAGLGTEVVLIDIEEVTYAAFTEAAASFTAGKKSYTLTIRCTNPLGGARTTLIDNIWLNKLTKDPPPAGTLMIVR